MTPLISYIESHTKQVPVGSKMMDYNLVFFGVNIKSEPNGKTLTNLINEDQLGKELDIFGDSEYSYIQIGALIGDQGLAMRLMALMDNAGLISLLTPYTVIGEEVDRETALHFAKNGFITMTRRSVTEFIDRALNKAKELQEAEDAKPQRTIKQNIEDHGWHMFHIFPSEGCDSKNFFYTIGLTEMNLPELILVGGIPDKAAHSIFNLIIEDWKKDGVKLGVNNSIIQDRSGNNLPVDLVGIENSKPLIDEYAIQLFNYYDKSGKNIEVVQVVWCDEQGLLPQEEGFSMHDKTFIFQPKTVKFEA